ncbi:MAG: cupredoxin domain-containing protein [Patescibacteria group bacterium]
MKDIKNKKENNKTTRATLIVLTVFLLIGLGFVIFGDSKISNTENIVQNVEVRDGTQYVTVNARGGYLPRISSAQSGIPTKLIMKTTGTFDCSSSLTIPELGYRKMLPQNGETEIDLGVRKPGSLRGLCSMGMYNFEINFI